jgi:hypothetical protein
MITRQGDPALALPVPPGHDNPDLVLPRQGNCVYWLKDVKPSPKNKSIMASQRLVMNTTINLSIKQ